MNDENRYVCVCAKVSRDRWKRGPDTSPGWDESCSMNAALCRPRTAADVLVPAGCLWVEVDPDTGADTAFTGDESRELTHAAKLLRGGPTRAARDKDGL